MTNIDELVKALRICNKPKGHRCSECPVFSRYPNRVCKSMVDKQSADAIEALQSENISLRAARDRARLDCAVAERNHMNTLERFLEAQERIDELKAENTQLRAERDALLKSFTVTSQPIKVIQPKGVVE